MPKQLETERFHVLYGPSSLFERVRYKYKEERILKTNATHFKESSDERKVPIEKIIHFDPKIWKLILVEVFTKKGRFASTTWELSIDGCKWWVVIGLHDTIITVYNLSKGKIGNGDSIVRGGEFFQFVESVNRE